MKFEFFPLYDAAGDDGGIGGGGTDAPDLSGGSLTGADGTKAPSAIDIKDDSLVRIGDQKDPVQFGKWYKGFQGQLTKATQERAALERKYAETEASSKELKSNYERLMTEVQRAKQTGNKEDALAALRNLQYISGQDMASIVETVQGRFNQFQGEFAGRDKAIMFLGEKLKDVMTQLQGYQQKETQVGFGNKIDKFLKDSGFGPELKDLAEEIYLAYEGDDLDQEFPDILKKRVDQVQRYARAAEQKRISDNKRNMFVPGKDQRVGPTGALKSKLAKGKAKDVASELWDAMVSDDQPSNRT
jgi:uncharacterized protein YihD (DUF1040 family)